MKILILAALEKEISVLNELINAESKGSFNYAKVKENEIYTSITGVGTVNAYSTTSSLIKEIHPDIVINIGSAGGHTLGVNDGDIIVCDEAIYHADDTSWKLIEESELTLKGDNELIALLEKVKTDVTIRHGKTLSGDFFTEDKEMIKSLHNKYHHLCEDMETIAIYKACKENSVPAIAYRIISNNELKGTSYNENALRVNKILQIIIAELLNSI